MAFSKSDLEIIKSKISLSSEIEKKTKVVKKGKDYWCCCLFHEEKTPSCKINDELGSYYCFGCGAKGDIFTLYTDLYKYTFFDAVKDLALRAGLNISSESFQKNKQNEIVFKILEIATNWFKKNLEENNYCKEYLKKRSISESTIQAFKIGYSYNSKSTLYNYLSDNNFKEEDIIKSNLIKKDKNNKIRDFFYKRLIFPIHNEQNKIVGFGGRVLDNSNPKYINSPESYFFKKRNILYNLNEAKHSIRSKNNMLICEGYMDVISLYEKNIKTAVAPLGTSLTEDQLSLSWKYANKPTIMFDGDSSGLRASYKSALMALQYLSPNKFLQFIKLPANHDPDSYINEFSYNKFVSILKNPISIVDFIFQQSSSTINLQIADNKISFDKYIDDLVETIKDKKIKYFYKNEFKKLFYEKLKLQQKKVVKTNTNDSYKSLLNKQINSFLATYFNHSLIRNELYELLAESELLDNKYLEFLNYFHNSEFKELNYEKLKEISLPLNISKMLNKVMENSVFQLFPYSKIDNNSQQSLQEVKESIKNLNTRLLNLKKINKSLNEFDDKSSSLSWEELKKITSDFHHTEED